MAGTTDPRHIRPRRIQPATCSGCREPASHFRGNVLLPLLVFKLSSTYNRLSVPLAQPYCIGVALSHSPGCTSYWHGALMTNVLACTAALTTTSRCGKVV